MERSPESESAAEVEGIAEMRKELQGGASFDHALYRGWIEYHNRRGGARSWQAWQQRADIYKQAATAALNERREKDMGKNALLKALQNEGARVPGAHPFAALETRVASAESAVAKATAANDDYAIAATREELRAAKRQLTMLKMIASENARERDPQMVSRALRGQGVPLLSNRRALPDDSSLRGI